VPGSNNRHTGKRQTDPVDFSFDPDNRGNPGFQPKGVATLPTASDYQEDYRLKQEEESEPEDSDYVEEECESEYSGEESDEEESDEEESEAESEAEDEEEECESEYSGEESDEEESEAEDEEEECESDQQVEIADLKERLILQSKRIRDLEQEKKSDTELWTPVLKGLQLSSRAFPPGTDLREKAGGEALRQRHRMELLENGVDIDVQCEAERASEALAEVKRLKRELEAEREVTTAAQTLDRARSAMSLALREENNSLKERNRYLVEELDRLKREALQPYEFEQMRRDLATTRGKLLVQIGETTQLRHELDRIKLEAGR
jgi:hypothetical protein